MSIYNIIYHYIYNQWRISAHWDNKYATGFRAAHVCFIPAVKADLYYIQLKTIEKSSLFISDAAISMQAQHETCV